MAVAIAVLFVAWRGGRFDRALVNVGLNAKECARNGFGATFCGRELIEYREGQKRAGEAVAKSKRENELAQQKAQAEANARQQKHEEESAPLLGPVETEAERLYRQAEELWHRVE
jgi:hypothetical protein